MINAVGTEGEVEEAKKLIASASEYAVAMSIELARRKLGADEAVSKNPKLLKRSLELSAYFTIPKIQVPHRQLALANAMKLAMKAKNYSSALGFVNRILANGLSNKISETVSKCREACSVAVCLTVLTFCRLENSSPSSSATPVTQLRSSLTSLPNSTSAPPLTHPYTAAPALSSAHLTEASTTPSTRALNVSYVMCVRWARAVVG